MRIKCDGNLKIQVAQRATIAHLSPMCQGQSALKPYAAFPPTPMVLHIKFDQDWPTGFRDIQVQNCKMSGLIQPKSNSTELLCLSWLPATLMMIRSKMNKLDWRHHFPIISLWEMF